MSGLHGDRVGGQVGRRQRAVQRGQVLPGLREQLARAGQGDQRVGLDGTAREHLRRLGLQVDPRVERLGQLLRARAVEHEPERPFVVVLEHVDHRAVEVGILEWWGGEQQPPLGRWAPGSMSPVCRTTDGLVRSEDFVHSAGSDKADLTIRARCVTNARTGAIVVAWPCVSCMIMRWAHGQPIIGASGYTGAELLRLLAGHPDLQLTVATGDTPGRHADRGPVPVPRRDVSAR